MSRPGGRDRLLLGGALAALVLVAALWSASGLNTRDEAWFLQVVARVSDGEVLYRDVFFGATPLSVWLTAPLVLLFGAQLVWVKLAVTAAFAASLGLVVVIARRLGAGITASLLLAAATLVFAVPYRGSLYQPLATAFLLACLAATLAWLTPSPRERLLVLAAGGAAGLAFASKQNVGLYALAALLAAIILAGAGQRLRGAALALAGFLACALVPIVPVLATGGLGKLVDYGFTNKSTYADVGRVSYLSGLRKQAGEARDLDVYAVLPAYQVLLYLAVPAVLVLLGVAWVKTSGAERRRVEVVWLFSAAAAVAILPRADAAHVDYMAPVLLVGGWYALHLLARALAPSRLRLVAIAAAVVLVPGVLVRAAWPALQVVDGGARLSTLPQARGVLIDPGREETMRETSREIARAAEDGPLFLATREAGFYYLLADVRNPTPFDFPLATAFGRTGQDELVADIKRGELATVCLGITRAGDLTPFRLVYAVKTTMEPSERTPACRFYRRAEGQ